MPRQTRNDLGASDLAGLELADYSRRAMHEWSDTRHNELRAKYAHLHGADDFVNTRGLGRVVFGYLVVVVVVGVAAWRFL